MPGRMDSGNKTSVLNSGRKSNSRIINTVVADHFEMLIRDMNNETLNKFNNGNGFNDEFVIFMPVVMESNMRAGVRINTGSGNNWPAKIAANVLRNDRRITIIGFSVNVESFAMITVDSRFDFFKRRAQPDMKTIKKSGTEGVAQKSIVEMFDAFPRSNAPDGDFGDEDMNVRIPLKAAPKGVKNADKAGSKTLGFIEFAEHAKNDVTDGMKKTVE